MVKKHTGCQRNTFFSSHSAALAPKSQKWEVIFTYDYVYHTVCVRILSEISVKTSLGIDLNPRNETWFIIVM